MDVAWGRSEFRWGLTASVTADLGSGAAEANLNIRPTAGGHANFHLEYSGTYHLQVFVWACAGGCWWFGLCG